MHTSSNHYTARWRCRFVGGKSQNKSRRKKNQCSVYRCRESDPPALRTGNDKLRISFKHVQRSLSGQKLAHINDKKLCTISVQSKQQSTTWRQRQQFKFLQRTIIPSWQSILSRTSRVQQVISASCSSQRTEMSHKPGRSQRAKVPDWRSSNQLMDGQPTKQNCNNRRGIEQPDHNRH